MRGGVQSWRAATAALAVAELSGSYSLIIMPFVLAAMMNAFRLSEGTASRVVSLELFFMTLGSILVSVMLRPGRSVRSVLTLGAAAIVFANIGCALLRLPLVVGVGRALAGTGEGVIMATTGLAVCAMPNTHRVFSTLAMVSACVAIVSLVITPFVANHAGPAGIFWLLALLALPLFLFVQWIPAAPNTRPVVGSRSRSARLRGAPILLGYLAFWAGGSGMWVYAERIGENQGLTPQQIGVWLALATLGGLAGPPLAALLAPRVGLRASIVVGCMGLGVAAICFVFGGRPWTYGLGAMLASLWQMLALPCFRSRMASIDPSGRTVARSAAVYTIGFGLAPLIISMALVRGRGYATIGIFCVICFLASALLGASRFLAESGGESSPISHA